MEHSMLAKLKFITDMPNSSFRGSNPDEQKKIDTIRKEFASYLYSSQTDVPNDLLERLGKLADEIFAGTDTDGIDVYIHMYEYEP